MDGLIINNIVISSPKNVKKTDKITNHPILNPNYILGKKENTNDKQGHFVKINDNKDLFSANKDNKKNQENKKLKEKIKEKAKNTQILLNNNKIIYENEKIMRKIDEFDARLYKNFYEKNSHNRNDNNEIKIRFVEKKEQDRDAYVSNVDSASNHLILHERENNKRKIRKNHNIELDIDVNKSNNNQVTPKTNIINKGKIFSNKNISKNKIDPVLVDNLFPYSKDVMSNKNGNQDKNIFKNNYLFSNLLSNREEESSDKLFMFKDNKNKDDRYINKEKKIHLNSHNEMSSEGVDDFSDKVINFIKLIIYNFRFLLKKTRKIYYQRERIKVVSLIKNQVKINLLKF